jgi:hypothetical protein
MKAFHLIPLEPQKGIFVENANEIFMIENKTLK